MLPAATVFTSPTGVSIFSTSCVVVVLPLVPGEPMNRALAHLLGEPRCSPIILETALDEVFAPASPRDRCPG